MTKAVQPTIKTSKAKKVLVGTVVSDKMVRTAIVEVPVWKIHRVLKKRYQRHTRLMVENPDNTYKVGDLVEITETSPLSRHKHWAITRKVDIHNPKGSK